MASPLPGVVATTASPAAPASSASARPGATPFVRTSAAVFAAFVLIQLIEYGALSIYVPFLKASRLTTLLSYGLMAMVIIRYKGEVFASYQAKLFGTFVVFTGVGILWAVVRSYVPLALRYHVDYFGLFIITAFIVDSPRRARVLGMAFAAITVLLVVTNRNMFGQEIRFGAFAAAYFMGDGNDFGWGLIVMLPLTLYLMVGRRPLLIRAIGAVGLLFNLVGIIGTESRGATIALVACMLLFWATVARRKLLFAGVAVAGVIAVLLLAPPAYFARMNTLKNVDDDNSAQGRLRAWRAARQMALDYPLGVGANNFNSAYGRFYIPADTSGWAANRWMSTHSCYFKVLAEYGYPGLILFLSILFITARDNVLSARRLRRAEGAAVFEPEWPLLLNVSLTGYAICALFLGGITYPHLYLLAGLTVATTRVSLRAEAAPAGAGAALPRDAAPADPRPTGRDRAARPALQPRPTAGPGRFF
jgi:probable O-glycosylation ligase (exosortase A-associated)